MPIRRGTGLVIIAALFVSGCANRDRAADSRPASPEDVQRIRASLTAADPKAIVGTVIATLPDEDFAAVGDVPVAEFRIDEPITFIDRREHPLAHGVIRNITADALHVKYSEPLEGGREPRVGDLAVRFKP